MRILINLLLLISTTCINAKGLYNDLVPDSIVHKTIRANNAGIIMDFNYCGGYGEFGQLVTKLMGEVPYSALVFSFMNEIYDISIKDQCADYVLKNVLYEDSVELDISIYPIYEKVGDNPLSIITGVRKISTDTIPK